ncbi:MAG: hypothetical protein V4515_12475 [Chloroflexota bacterium]
MAGEQPPARRDDFRTARIVGALALLGAVVMMAIIDAVSLDYQVDHVVLGLVLVAALTLVGLDAPAIFRGGKDR